MGHSNSALVVTVLGLGPRSLIEASPVPSQLLGSHKQSLDCSPNRHIQEEGHLVVRIPLPCRAQMLPLPTLISPMQQL